MDLAPAKCSENYVFICAPTIECKVTDSWSAIEDFAIDSLIEKMIDTQANLKGI